MKINLCKMENDFSVLEKIKDIINSGIFVNGPHIESFEQKIAKLFNVKYVVAVNSGTSALYSALISLGIGKDDEIIVPSLTFFATISPILALNAKPVFIDIDPISFCMDENQILEKITSQTKAIIPVHLYGCIANMPKIMKIAKEKGIFVIEDSCQAHGAVLNGHYAGSFGDIGCFSLYPSKNLSVLGQGGLITTNNENIQQKLIAIRQYGAIKKNFHDFLGFNFAMSEITAVTGEMQCEKLFVNNSKRIQIAQLYARKLKNYNQIILPEIKTDGSHVYHLFVIRIPIQKNMDRNILSQYLETKGIQTGIHYPIPCHLQTVLKSYLKSQTRLPLTEKYCSEVLSIPMSPLLNSEEIDHIIDSIHLFIEKN